ncbi:DUF3732 domain-containing protein [Paenibacillus nicotianae]|uniref:DUF3732 domain-containing protein n=1 Tax=Paenibacillus nicotianae TaxID=1526551 RepID=A0ABW4UVU5_9BACL
MKRWNIRKILLYSHDQKISEIILDLEKVNIITGDSQTGKSALPEIIDYVLGSQECHIPTYVRRTLSWVGLLWVKNETEYAMFRKVPRAPQKSSSSMHIIQGKSISIPLNSNSIPPSTNIEGALKKFERLLGIGDAKSEVYGSERERKNISIRSAVPYLLQDDATIINKNSLLRGMEDYGKRQTIIDALPYYLGITDEKTIDKEIELKILLKKLKRFEKELSEDEKIADSSKAFDLLFQAKQLGLTEFSSLNLNENKLNKQLEEISDWTPSLNTGIEDNELTILNDNLLEKQNETISIKRKIMHAKRSLQFADDFENTAHNQKRRLEVVKIFKEIVEPSSCPLCNQVLKEQNNSVQEIYKTVNEVNSDLESIEKERPKIDQYIISLKEKLLNLNEEIIQIQREISSQIKVEDEYDESIVLNDRRNRLIGSIKFYLDAVKKITLKPSSTSFLSINRLKENIDSLSAEIDVESRKEALENAEIQIARIAKDIISQLPFEARYQNNPIYLNFRSFKIGVSLPSRIEYMRDVGSDENYLSLHVSTMLAFHRYFAEFNRPVPGVILFDQLSRPYFPSDEESNIVEIGTELDNDRKSLLQYFDFLFKEVEKGHSLQIIVIEHAYFKDNKRYTDAVKKRWKKEIDGLIPIDWPERD